MEARLMVLPADAFSVLTCSAMSLPRDSRTLVRSLLQVDGKGGLGNGALREQSRQDGRLSP